MPKTETADGDELRPGREQVEREEVAGDAAAGPTDAGSNENTSRWRLSNWPLRYKLAVVLLVPLVTALAFGSLRALRALGEAEEFNETVAQVELGEQVTAVAHALQRERTFTVAAMAGGSVDDSTVAEQATKVDAAVDRLRAALGERELDDEAVRRDFDRALQRLNALDPLRSKINNTPFPDLSAYTTYNSILEPLLQLGRTVNLSVTDRELLRRGTTVQAISEAKEYTSRQNASLQMAVGHGAFISDLLDRAVAAQAGASAAVDTFNANATLNEQQLYLDRVSGAEVDNRERLIATAYSGATSPGGIRINSAQLTADGSATTDMMRQVESELLAGLREQAEALAADASRSAWIFFGLMILTLIATVALTLVVARALTKPLRTLRSSALEVAYVRLPETVRRILADPNPIEASRDAVAPVPVHTREEIGEVARSFDVVHERAIRLAAEQALLRENVNGIFVNLSRRSQRLVERQLGVIDRLESDEQDPDQLASLFELDHLATRLRRNGESLLVLSGAGLTKTMSKPVPAADVVGAAVSEIEQYARVELGTIPEVAVHGRAVHDLVHLLAELLDNATYFSEPETKISVRAVVTRRNSLAVQITDRGVGMSEQQLTEANERLADPPDLDVSVTRRMGLYVVARLAKRHGIEVRLRENEDIEGGVIARVVVPTELLTGASRATGSTGTIPPEAWAEMSGSSGVDNSSGSAIPSPPAVPPLPAPRGSSNGNRAVPPPPAPSARSTSQEPAGPPESSGGADPAGQDPAGRDRPQGRAGQQDTGQQDTGRRAPSEPADSNGLRALDQPISLDDLVGGASKAAGPFLSPVPDTPAPEPPTELVRPAGAAETEEPQWPVESPDGDRADGHVSGVEGSSASPEREPRSVPGVSEHSSETASVGGDGSALEDDVPTRRLPIYQSVLSRWFSEETPLDHDVDSGDEAWGAAPVDVGGVDTGDAAGGEMTAADSSGGSTGGSESGTDTGTDPADDWHSISDTGWQAAHALLEVKHEETTPAGLPKRVPNAYLVPGSVTPGRGDAFTDTTVGEPGRGAIARSAEAARNRMMSFQRGYQSGRHALKEPSAQSEQFDETGATPRPNGAKE